MSVEDGGGDTSRQLFNRHIEHNFTIIESSQLLEIDGCGMISTTEHLFNCLDNPHPVRKTREVKLRKRSDVIKLGSIFC
jgi:hypothetical protein